MAPHQDNLLALLERVLDMVSPLGLGSVVLPQDSLQDVVQGNLQAVGHVKLLAMANKVQGPNIHLAKGEAGLPQGSLLPLKGMDLVQESLLDLVKGDIHEVSPLKEDIAVLSLDSQQAVNSVDLVVVTLLGMVKVNMAQASLPNLVSMALLIVSLPAMAHITQGLETLPPREHIALVQDSLLI